LRLGASLLAVGGTLDDLVDRIACLNLDADAFRLEVHRLSDGVGPPSRDVILSVAQALRGASPNLSAPRHRFAVVIRDSGFWFGEIVAETDRSWKRHDAKPAVSSCGLPQRLARAVVNLAASPRQVVVNPCCGAGSLLLEASSIGAIAYGADWNPKMVATATKKNHFFGYSAHVELADASTWQRQGNVLLADLPYGHNCKTHEENLRGILAQAAALAPVGVFVYRGDISEWILRAGFGRSAVYRVQGSAEFSRFAHLAER
jgi:tRNA G10  N-methylase Trm11